MNIEIANQIFERLDKNSNLLVSQQQNEEIKVVFNEMIDLKYLKPIYVHQGYENDDNGKGISRYEITELGNTEWKRIKVILNK